MRRYLSDLGVGVKTLSPTNSGPSVPFTFRLNSWSVLAVPGDFSTASDTTHGSYVMQFPGAGGSVRIAGIDLSDGSHRGVFRPPEDPAAADALCAALTP